MALTAVAVAVAVLPAAALTAPAAGAADGTRHYVSNLHGSTAPAAYGWDVFDTGPSPAAVNGLPAGVQALVWLGQKCPTIIDASFRGKVDALAGNPRVYGYYLSDEPHIAACPGGPAALASRADYIRSRTGGAQKSFIVLSKVADFGPFRPEKSHVDLVGLDPYPCSIANPQCDIAKIGQRVSAALAAGIPLATVVPVYQNFGQELTASHYYNLPTVAQMVAMLAEWDRLVPAPVMDYSYSWGNQSSSNPTLVDSPELRQVMADHMAG